MNETGVKEGLSQVGECEISAPTSDPNEGSCKIVECDSSTIDEKPGLDGADISEQEDKGQNVNPDTNVNSNEMGECEVVGDNLNNIETSENIENDPLIRENLDQELVSELMDMGFSKIKSEKALFFTSNESLDAALSWIEGHQEDKCVEEPVCKKDAESFADKKLTPEEAKRKAYEIQRRMNEMRIAREKKEEQEREKKRIESTKLIQEQKKKMEEAERKRFIELAKREKIEHQNERDRQRELMKREWEEKHNRPYEEEETKPEIKTAKDKIIYWTGQLRNKYKDTDSAGLKACLSIIIAYCKNVQKNPGEMKYRRIKKDNVAFKTRVLPYDGSLNLLEVVGFVSTDNDEFLELETVDGFVLSQCIKYAETLVNRFL